MPTPSVPNLNEEFFTWIQGNQAAFKKMLEVIRLWYENQGKLPPTTPSAGPKEFSPGEQQPLTTVGISEKDLDALYHGYAQAIVKEKAIEWIKGFITGVTLLAGQGCGGCGLALPGSSCGTAASAIGCATCPTGGGCPLSSAIGNAISGGLAGGLGGVIK